MNIANRFGPIIRDCTFEMLGDDGLIFKNKGLTVEKSENEGKTLYLTVREVAAFAKSEEVLYDEHELGVSVSYYAPVIGDSLAAFNPDSGTSLGTANVISVTVEDSIAIVNLDRGFDGLIFGNEWNSTVIYNLNTLNNGYEVRGCKVHCRRWAVLTMSTSGTIEGNRFEGNPGNAILIINSGIDLADNAGYVNTNLRIVNNYFSDNLRGDIRGTPLDRAYTAVIASLVIGLTPEAESKLVTWAGHKNITLVNNTISQMTGDFPAIMLGNVDGALIAKNEVWKNGTSPAFLVLNSQNITIAENVVHNGCIAVDNGSTEEVVMEHNTVPDYCN